MLLPLNLPVGIFYTGLYDHLRLTSFCPSLDTASKVTSVTFQLLVIQELLTRFQGAVLAMTRELAMVHAREGIRINSICP